MNFKEVFKAWAISAFIVVAIAVPLRILAETDGLSSAGRARFVQKVFGHDHPPSAATLAAR